MMIRPENVHLLVTALLKKKREREKKDHHVSLEFVKKLNECASSAFGKIIAAFQLIHTIFSLSGHPNTGQLNGQAIIAAVKRKVRRHHYQH